MTYGEQAVGLSFNRIKQLYAQIIDLCNDMRSETYPSSDERSRLFSIAITQTQTAQMWAVKAITWKHD